MNALITGGAGFIGSNLARFLLKEGNFLCIVDNFSTGQREHAREFSKMPNCEFIEADTTADDFIRSVEHIKFDRVYHLACPTGVPNITRLGEEMMMSCSLGTRNVLEIAKRSGASFVLTSSCEVYGQPEVFPQKENYTGNVATTGPRSAYEEGKRFAESLVALYVRKYNLNAKIVRIFNVYGPGMSLSDQRVIPQFMASILQDRELTIYGDGMQKRTFTYVDDLVYGLKLVMERGNIGEIYNIGSEDEITMAGLASMITKLFSYGERICFSSHFTEDHKGRRPCIEKIKTLGWKPTVSLNDGLARMFLYYKGDEELCSDIKIPAADRALGVAEA